MKIQLENGSKSPFENWKKCHENNKKLRIGGKEKKAVCKTARRAHSQKQKV